MSRPNAHQPDHTRPREWADSSSTDDHRTQPSAAAAATSASGARMMTTAGYDDYARKHQQTRAHRHPQQQRSGSFDGTELRPAQDAGADGQKNCFGRVGQKLTLAVHKVLPPGGILSSGFNMASGSIGAGILGLPGATDSAGLLMAMIYLVIITFFSVYSMYILAIAAQKTRIRSFEGLSRWLFPRSHYAFSYWAAFIRWFHAFAGCVAYIISIGNCFKPLFSTAYSRNPDNKALKYFNSTSGNRLLTSLVWLCIMVPLVIPKHIDSLRYASAFAVTFMIYFVIIIVIHSCMNGLKENAKNVRVSDASGYDPATDGNMIFLFRTGNSVVNSVGVFMFAYVCQINALEIWNDFQPSIRTTRNYTYSATIGMLICGVLYVLVCVFGYFDFGSAKLLNKSILLMYNPLDEPAVLIAYIGVMVKLCVAYALLTIASRNSIYYIIGWQQKYRTRSERSAVTHTQNHLEQEMVREENNGNEIDQIKPLQAEGLGHPEMSDPAALEDGINAEGSYDDVQKPGAKGGDAADKKGAAAAPELTRLEVDDDMKEDDADDISFIDNIPFWQHLIAVVILSVASLLCGLFIPSINMVFGFAGAISGGFLAFIFPALFYMYSGGFTLQQVGYFNYFCTYALLFCGVVGIVFGTGGTIYDTV